MSTRAVAYGVRDALERTDTKEAIAKAVQDVLNALFAFREVVLSELATFLQFVFWYAVVFAVLFGGLAPFFHYSDYILAFLTLLLSHLFGKH